MKKLLKKITFRTIPVYIGVIVLLWKAAPEKLFFIIGLILVVIGEFFRLWGCGHLVKTKELIISGPYAYVRHPLYLGTYLIGFGFSLAAGMWWFLVLFQAAFLLYYYPRKEIIESSRLAAHYGEEYLVYMKSVPALLPSLKAYKKSGLKWSFGKILKNDELGIVFAVLAGIVILYLKLKNII